MRATLFGTNMQIIALAGGFGTRLRPWTKHLAKPLLPLLDKTLLEQVVHSLPTDMIDEVIIAAGYGIEQMREYFSERSYPFKITIVEETEPLGTGGAIANCREHLTGTFAVMNADLISSLKLDEMLEFHKSQGGLATISLWEVEDPTRFGIADLGSDGKISRFKEKPTLEEAFSRLINAGAYILEPEIFDHMPDGAHSIERDVYSNIAPLKLLNGFPFEGYFVDAGTPSSWLDAMKVSILNNRWNTGRVSETSWFASRVTFEHPNKNSNEVPDHCKIVNSSVGKNVSCGLNVEISGSYLMDGVKIRSNASIHNCLIGQGAEIGTGVHLSNAVVDFDAVINIDDDDSIGGIKFYD